MTKAIENKTISRHEDCAERIPVIEFTGFGKAYVPQQELCELYSATDGFTRGTIFPELDIPYMQTRKNSPSKGGGNHEFA